VQAVAIEIDGECLESLETYGVCTLTSIELQRQDTHAQEIASVDSLKALGNDSLNSLQEWTPNDLINNKLI
jgi:hypothetical protein